MQSVDTRRGETSWRRAVGRALTIFAVVVVFLGTPAYGVGSLAHRPISRLRRSELLGGSCRPKRGEVGHTYLGQLLVTGISHYKVKLQS